MKFVNSSRGEVKGAPMNEPYLTEYDAVSIVKCSVLSLVFGMAIGAFGMVYFEPPKAQPVAANHNNEVQLHYRMDTQSLDAAMDKLKTSLEVHFIQQEAALRKMQQDTVKLSTINKAMAAQLIERAPVKRVEQGHERSSGDHPASNPTTHDAAPLSIQHMATELGVSKMVVK